MAIQTSKLRPGPATLDRKGVVVYSYISNKTGSMKDKNSSTILIGIAGGTGSGKTLVARRVLEDLLDEQFAMVQQDSYYKNLSHLPFEERSHQNFDHPDAIDIELLYSHVKALLSGETIQQPVYDFSRHLRVKETHAVGPHPLIVLEGILVLAYPQLRELMDIKLFVDTDADIRLIRRLKRDIRDRGRSLESVLEQYTETVQPMHLEFVEPSKRFADVIIPEGGKNHVAVDLIKTKIQALLNTP